MAKQMPRRAVLIGGAAAGVAGLAAASPWSRSPARTEEKYGGATLAVTHVAVVDASSPNPRRDLTVLIERGRIIAVGRASELSPPPGCTVVSGRGKFLIPGLIDMHAHSPEAVDVSPALYVANGVTSVREMAGTSVLHEWRAAVDRGELLGPRWTIGSEIVDGAPSLLLGPGESDGVITVKDAADVAAAMGRIRDSGADFVKVYSRVSAGAFQALAIEARRAGLALVGHVPDAVPVDTAVRLGLANIEHLQALGCSLSTGEAWAALAALRIAPGDYASWFRQLHPIEYAAMTRPDASRTARLLDLLAESETYVDPTLLMHLTVDRPEDVDTSDERLAFVPQEAREFWDYGMEEIYQAGRSQREVAEQRQLYDLRLELVGRLQSSGVRLLAGTEAGFIYAFPGFSMHDELVQLERAGLTPWQTLRAATLTSAEALGKADELGTVQPGKTADLVLLDRDPLETAANVRSISSVVVGGRLISPEGRRALLDDVRRAVARPRDTAARYTGCGCHLPRRSSRRRLA